MEYILIGLLFLLIISDSFLVKNIQEIDKSRAELYCMYRVWKGERMNESAVSFKMDLYFIIEGIRKDVKDRCGQYSVLWSNIPVEERDAFLDSLKPIKK